MGRDAHAGLDTSCPSLLPVMNRIYRSIWNAALATWVAAPETSRRTGRARTVAGAGLATLMLGAGGVAWGACSMSVSSSPSAWDSTNAATGEVSCLGSSTSNYNVAAFQSLLSTVNTSMEVDGSISVLAPINYSGSVNRTAAFRAAGPIQVNAPISATGSGALNGVFSSSSGFVSFGAGSGFNSNGGNLSLIAQAGNVQLEGVNLGTGTLTVNAGAAVTQTTPITAGRLTGSSGSTTVLTNAGNSISALGDYAAATGLYLSTSGPLAVDGNVVTSSLNLTSQGNIVVTGDITATAGMYANAASFSIGNGGTTGSVTGDINSNGPVTFNRSNNLSYSGTLSGVGSLNKTGSGTLTLTSGNSYSGGTTISQGVLAIGSATALGTGSVEITGNAELRGVADLNVGNVVQLSGGSTISASAGTTLRLTGDIYYDGLNIGSAGQTGIVDIASNAGGYLVGSALRVNYGTLRVSGGWLPAAATSFASATVSLGATLDLNDQTNASLPLNNLQGEGRVRTGTQATTGLGVNSGNFLGVIEGAGQLRKISGATLTLGGANTYAGGTVIEEGTLALTGNGALPAATALNILSAPGRFDISGISGAGTSIGTLAGTGTVSLGAKNITLGGAASTTYVGSIDGTGSLTKTGTGTQTLSGSNTYTGGTVVSAGTLALSGGASFYSGGSVQVVAGASFDISALAGPTATIGRLSGAGTVQLGTATLVLDGAGNSVFGGVISGAGSLVKQGSGSLTLNGANTYADTTELRGGSLILGSTAAAGASVAGAVTVAAGTTLGGHGRIAGDLVVAGGGSLAPGGSGTDAVGTLRVGGDLWLQQGSTLRFDFGSPGTASAAGQSDSIYVDGSVSLYGTTLNASDVGGMGPGVYNLLSYSGGLTRANGGIIAPGGGYVIQYLSVDKKINLITTAGYVLNFWNPNGASGGAAGGGSGTWSLANNSWSGADGAWSGPLQPTPAFAIFGGAAGQVNISNLDGAVTASGIQFTTDGYRLAGDALTLVASGTHPAPVEVRVGDGRAASAGWRATIDSVVAGSDGLAKTGAGTLALTGANTYTGGTTVRAAVLEISTDANLGAASEGLTLDGGALRIATGSAPVSSGRVLTLGAGGGTLELAGATLDFSGGIDGTGGLVVTGKGGTLNIATSNTYGGGTVLRDGASVLVAGVGTLGTGAVELGTQDTTLRFGAGASGGSNSYRVGRAGTTDTGNQLVFAQDATAASSTLNVNGAGWQASGANTLRFEGTSTAAASSIVNQGGVVRFEQNATAAGANIANGGASLLSFAGASSAGTSSIANQSGGVVRFADTASASNAAISNAAGGTLDVSGATGASGVQVGSLSGAGAVVLGGTKLTVGGLGRSDSVSGAVSDGGSQFAPQGSGTGGSLVKVGAGTLTLSGANTYTGGTALKQGRIDLGHSQALGTGALAMDDGTTLGFAADGLAIANAIELAGSNDPVIDTGAFGATIGGAISGGGFITKEGSGTLTLSGANTYTGATNVAQGTLRAGAANTFSAASAHSVAAGASLDLAGFDQRVASLTNGGTVSLPGTAPGATLTVTGAYVGNNGVLRLGTVLGSNGPSDRLVLDGAGATASGRTSVQIVNVGGLGGQTSGNGIEVIGAINGATTTAQTTRDAFVLAGGHVDAGAYEYRLYAADANGAGESWYLRSSTNVPEAAAPETAPAPAPAPAPVVTYRPEAALYASLPSQLRQGGLAMLGDLHKRVGDDDVKAAMDAGTRSAAQGDRRGWARVIATDIDIRQGGTVSPTSQGDWTGLQAGTDLLGAPNWRAGVYVGQLDGDARVNGFASGVQNQAVGSNDLRSQYLGFYGTYTGDSGFYADAVLQAGRHRYTVQPLGNAATEGRGDGLTASIEVGQPFALGSSGWAIEPQLQLIQQRLDLDNTTIAGAQVEPDADNAWTARIGVRLKGTLETGAGILQPYGRINVYRTSSGTDVARFVNGAFVTDIGAPIGGTSTELAGGFTLGVGPAASIYGEIGRVWANGGDARVEASISGSVGVRMKW